MTTKQQVQQVQKEAEDAFLDENVNLDLSGFPHLQKHVADGDDLPDERFAPLANDRPMRLRNEITRFVNQNASDGEVAKALADAGLEDEQRPRSFNTPGWTGEMRWDRGAWHFRVESEDGEEKRFKIAVTDREIAQTQAARYLAKGRVQIRQLTEEEQLYVARLAGQGKLMDAIQNYISYSIPDYDGTSDVSADPRYQSVCDAAAWYVFVNGTPQYQDSPEAREYITEYIGSRPVTVELLRFGFAAYQERQKKAERSLLLDDIENRNEPVAGPTYQELDELSTDEISQLRQDTLRLRAKQVKGGILN